MTTILTKKKDSSGVPATADITSSTGGAELAVNTADKRLYTKNSSNDIVEIGTNASELMVSGASTFRGAVSGSSTFKISGSAELSNNVNVGGTLTGSSTISDQDGDLRDIPLSTKSSGAYTLAIGDAGNQVTVASSNVVITVPGSTFGIGDIISVISVNGSTASLACTAVNAFKAGDLAATALHTLDANGVASIMFSHSADVAILTGNIS